MVSTAIVPDEMYVEAEIAAYQNDPEFIANGWALKVAEEVVSLLEEKGKNQTWLATSMDVSRSRVSAVLNAPPNMTLLTLARLSVALGVPAEIVFNPKRNKIMPAPGPSHLEDAVITGLGTNDHRVVFAYPIETGRGIFDNASS